MLFIYLNETLLKKGPQKDLMILSLARGNEKVPILCDEINETD